MALTATWYGKVMLSAFNKELDWNSDVIKGMLVGSGYTWNQDTHQYKSDITGEVSGTGYTAGGATIASPTMAYTGATNVFNIDGGDISWPASTLNSGANIPTGLVIYDSTPATDATRPIVGFVDFGGGMPTTNGTLAVTFDVNGIAKITVS